MPDSTVRRYIRRYTGCLASLNPPTCASPPVPTPCLAPLDPLHALDVFCAARPGAAGGFPGIPGQVPVNAGAVAGVNVEPPQRASARTNNVEARQGPA